MAQLIAATTKGEVDTNLQSLSRAIVDMRELALVLSNWRAPLDQAYLEALGYDAQQVAELSSFITICQSWVDQIGPGGTLSANDGALFARMLTQIFGLGGQAGIYTVPPPEPEEPVV